MQAKSGRDVRKKKGSDQQQGQKPELPGFWVRIKNFLSGGGAKPAKKSEVLLMKKPKGDYYKPKHDRSDIPPF